MVGGLVYYSRIGVACCALQPDGPHCEGTVDSEWIAFTVVKVTGYTICVQHPDILGIREVRIYYQLRRANRTGNGHTVLGPGTAGLARQALTVARIGRMYELILIAGHAECLNLNSRIPPTFYVSGQKSAKNTEVSCSSESHVMNH